RFRARLARLAFGPNSGENPAPDGSPRVSPFLRSRDGGLSPTELGDAANFGLSTIRERCGTVWCNPLTEASPNPEREVRSIERRSGETRHAGIVCQPALSPAVTLPCEDGHCSVGPVSWNIEGWISIKNLRRKSCRRAQ